MQQATHWIPRIFTQKEILVHWDFYKIHVTFQANSDDVKQASFGFINPTQRLNDVSPPSVPLLSILSSPSPLLPLYPFPSLRSSPLYSPLLHSFTSISLSPPPLSLRFFDTRPVPRGNDAQRGHRTAPRISHARKRHRARVAAGVPAPPPCAPCLRYRQAPV